MENKIIDNLTIKSVSIRTVYADGKRHRKSYQNSINGRREVENELSEDFKNAIFSVWGNEAILEDTVVV